MPQDFFGYLARISDGALRQDLARIAGVSSSTVTRWDPTRSDHVRPKADAVIAIARHYGRPPLEALIAAGILTTRDAAVRVTERPLADYPHQALLRELQNRLDGLSDPSPKIVSEEEPRPDDYDLAAGHVDRPDDRPAD